MSAFRGFPEQEVPDFPEINWQYCQLDEDVVEAPLPFEELQVSDGLTPIQVERLNRFRSMAIQCVIGFSELLSGGADERCLSGPEETLQLLKDELDDHKKEVRQGVP